MVICVVPVQGKAQADVKIPSAFIGVIAEAVEVVAVCGIEKIVSACQQFQVVPAGESCFPAHIGPQQGVGTRGWKEILKLFSKRHPEHMAGFEGEMQLADAALKHEPHFWWCLQWYRLSTFEVTPQTAFRTQTEAPIIQLGVPGKCISNESRIVLPVNEQWQGAAYGQQQFSGAARRLLF